MAIDEITNEIFSRERLEKVRRENPSRAKYEVIRDFLLEGLGSGYFNQGSALPSESILIKKLGVARSTIRQAIDELAKDGLVKRVQGKGNYFTRNGTNGTDERLTVLSLILPEISRGLYPVLAKGFDHQASDLNQQVLLCNTDYDINKQGNIILQMIEKGVAGAVMVPALDPLTPAFQVRQLQRNNIPVVFCHRAVSGVSAPLITWDAEAVARMAGETLINKGHRRIAYFARTKYALSEMHKDSLRRTLLDAGLELPDHCTFFGNSPNVNGELQLRIKALKALLSGSDPVTAIFCNDDNEAELVHYALVELGIRVPDDVSLIGFGDCHLRDGVFLNRLTSVVIDEYELGVKAAKLLSEMQAGKRPIDSEEVIYKPLSLYEGESVAQI
jgi:GntR family transcriptional regulator of arabinose operon